MTGALVELLCEVVFSPIGYRVSKKWAARGVGQEYLDFVASRKMVRASTKGIDTHKHSRKHRNTCETPSNQPETHDNSQATIIIQEEER